MMAYQRGHGKGSAVMCGICGAVWSDPTAFMIVRLAHGHDEPDRSSRAGRRRHSIVTNMPHWVFVDWLSLT